MRISDWSSDVCSSDLFNPIIPIGDRDFAARLIHLFRVDSLYAPTAAPAVSAFIETQSQIPKFDLGGPLVMDRGHLGKASTVADLMHPIGRLYQENYRNIPQAEPSIRSEENTSELQSLMRISYAVFCLKTKI